MVDTVFSPIADAFERDEPVAIPRFGRFALRIRAVRQGRNPQSGEVVDGPASKVLPFEPAKALRNVVNE